MYIESRAYVSNLRQKLVCGSPLLAPRMTYYEWWSRALQPGVHFVEVADGPDMCDDVVNKVTYTSVLQRGNTLPKCIRNSSKTTQIDQSMRACKRSPRGDCLDLLQRFSVSGARTTASLIAHLCRCSCGKWNSWWQRRQPPRQRQARRAPAQPVTERHHLRAALAARPATALATALAVTEMRRRGGGGGCCSDGRVRC